MANAGNAEIPGLDLSSGSLRKMAPGSVSAELLFAQLVNAETEIDTHQGQSHRGNGYTKKSHAGSPDACRK